MTSFATEIKLIDVDVPLRPSVGETRSSVHRMTAARHLLVQLLGPDGVTGVGEIVPRAGIYGETPGSCRGIVEEVVMPRLAEFRGLLDLAAFLDRIPGNPAACAGVELAAWDLVGKRHNASVAQLHGAPAEYAVPVAGTVSFGAPGEMARVAEQSVAAGYPGVKVKVGRDPDADVAGVAAVHSAIGPGVPLALDANQQWTPAQARRALSAILDLGVEITYVEEPIPASRRREREQLADAIPIRHALDESLVHPADGLREVEWGIARVFNLKATRSGIRGCVALAAIAAAAGIEVVVGTMRELSPGTAANAQLAAIVGASWAELVPALDWVHPLSSQPIPIKGGYYLLNHQPGLGVTLDDDAVARYRAPTPLR